MRGLLTQKLAPVAEEFLGDIIGIKEIINGQKLTTEGISVLNDRTIRIKIDAPKAYFLAKLSYPTAFILTKRMLKIKIIIGLNHL